MFNSIQAFTFTFQSQASEYTRNEANPKRINERNNPRSKRRFNKDILRIFKNRAKAKHIKSKPCQENKRK